MNYKRGVYDFLNAKDRIDVRDMLRTKSGLTAASLAQLLFNALDALNAQAEVIAVVRGMNREAVGSPAGMCWCDKAIGNPMMRGHAAYCLELRSQFDA